MKVLLFGKDGMVGRAFQRLASESGVTLEAYGRAEADFAQPELCAGLVSRSDADVVVIAAAYTAVDRAEDEREAAIVINGKTPGAIAEAAARRDMPVVHISTDYVFNAEHDQSLQPGDPVDPVNAYGASKLAGEEAVRAAGGPHAIFRTSWVFSADGQNFVKTMLRLGAERTELNVVGDQIGGPTSARRVADACLAAAKALLADPAKSGTYHYAGEPAVSWADFARDIFALSGLDVQVVDIPTNAYPTPAKRPANSRLDSSKAHAVFGLAVADWKRDLAETIQELQSK